MFLKPRVTQNAAKKYKFDFDYTSKPSWPTYHSLLNFAKQIKQDTIQYKPRDLIDLQSFIWVMGSMNILIDNKLDFLTELLGGIIAYYLQSEMLIK